MLVTLAAGALVCLRPPPLLRDVTWGAIFVPFAGDSRWLTPVGAVAIVAAALFLVRILTASRPLVDLRSWAGIAREADLTGALLLAAALSGVILAFATADPRVEVFSDRGLWYLLGGAVAAVAFAVHLRRTEDPIIPTGALRRTPAWGSLAVSFFVGAALIAALIDIPIFARTTIYPDSQLMAALVLVRFLVALPVGAVLGGYLTHRLPAGVVAAVGMAFAAVGFVWMSAWHLETLEHASATIPLVIGGFGFGLALAPVNAAVLAATDDDVHGLATATVVVARMVGMLVGISALTTHRAAPLLRRAARHARSPRGLRRQEQVQGVHPPAQGGRHRPGAHRLPRRRRLRRHRRPARAGAVPHRRHTFSRRGHPAARRRLTTTLGPRG